jgi:hypothetical protein
MHAPRAVVPLLLLGAAALGCKGRPAQPPKTAQPAASAVTVAPAPKCDAPLDAPNAAPRGKVLAIYHTANVVGEVEPCG